LTIQGCRGDLNAVIDETRPTGEQERHRGWHLSAPQVDTLDNRSISDDVLANLQVKIKNSRVDARCFRFSPRPFQHSELSQADRGDPGWTYRVADSQVASRWATSPSSRALT